MVEPRVMCEEGGCAKVQCERKKSGPGDSCVFSLVFLNKGGMVAAGVMCPNAVVLCVSA